MKNLSASIIRHSLCWCMPILAAAGMGTSALAAFNTHPDAENMQWIGHADLQGRPSYEPTVIQQGNRFILYVGHHAGSALNPLTGAVEANGTSIVDVTNPKQPVQLFHIP